MDISVIVQALAPVLFLLGLGFLAGRTGQFDASQTRVFSALALRYAIPAALFLGMAHFDRSLLLEQGTLVLIILFFYTGFFIAGYALLRVLKISALNSALFAYAGTSKAATIYGLVALTPIFGAELGRGMVGLCALVMNLSQLSFALYMFNSATLPAGQKVQVWDITRRTITNPLVLAPALGAVVSLGGFSIPALVGDVLDPLAHAAGAIALFACGLGMASFKMQFNSHAVALVTLIALVVQPVLFFLLLRLFDLSGPVAQAAFVISTFPIAAKALLFAETYESEEGEIATMLLVTSLAMVVMLPLSLWASRFL